MPIYFSLGPGRPQTGPGKPQTDPGGEGTKGRTCIRNYSPFCTLQYFVPYRGRRAAAHKASKIMIKRVRKYLSESVSKKSYYSKMILNERNLEVAACGCRHAWDASYSFQEDAPLQRISLTQNTQAVLPGISRQQIESPSHRRNGHIGQPI